MDRLKDFTSLVEESTETNPTMQSWLYNTQELERQLSERVISLCLYYDKIPEQLQPDYANTLINVLNSGDIWPSFFETSKLTENVLDFASYLESSGNPDRIRQGQELRKAISFQE